MARPRQQTPVPFFIPDGLTAKKIELEPTENSKERDLRLWKEKWSFLILELGASIVALVLVVALVALGFVILIRPASTPDERHFAMSLLAAVGTALAGFVFGRGSAQSREP